MIPPKLDRELTQYRKGPEDVTCWSGTSIRKAQENCLNLLDMEIGNVIQRADHQVIATSLYGRILHLEEFDCFWAPGGCGRMIGKMIPGDTLRNMMYLLLIQSVQAEIRAHAGKGFQILTFLSLKGLGHMQEAILGWSNIDRAKWMRLREIKWEEIRVDVTKLFPEGECFICQCKDHHAADCPDPQSTVPIVNFPNPRIKYHTLEVIRMLLYNDDGAKRKFSSDEVHTWVKFWGYDEALVDEYMEEKFMRTEDGLWTSLPPPPVEKPRGENTHSIDDENSSDSSQCVGSIISPPTQIFALGTEQVMVGKKRKKIITSVDHSAPNKRKCNGPTGPDELEGPEVGPEDAADETVAAGDRTLMYVK